MLYRLDILDRAAQIIRLKIWNTLRNDGGVDDPEEVKTDENGMSS